jgi:cyclophilin family peptidyl-prolyl cis-trans isomerase
MPGFIIQGGGYSSDLTSSTVKAIGSYGAITNEYSITRSNIRGTIAMAKVPDQPNSATNQWFINLANNASNLDNQNGGFTVFGSVINNGMSIADKIAALPTIKESALFSNLPIATAISNNKITGANLVNIISATVSLDKSTVTDADRIFNYLEAAYPDYASPANPLTPPASGSNYAAPYYYRYYTSSQSYIATANDKVLYLGPLVNNQITDLGTVATWLKIATEAGY